MKTFMLIMTIWGNQNVETYVVDSNISGEDCINALVELARPARLGNFVLSCELDYAPFDN